MRILLVEDHPAVAMISCNLLREVHGHDVAHATDGRQAIRALEDFRPELVLLDLNLPDMSGYEVASRMRALPPGREVVLVALTGFGDQVNTERAAAVGFDAHFRKPMDFERLAEIRRRRE